MSARRLLPITLVCILASCQRNQTERLSGATTIDSRGAPFSSASTLKNFDRATLHVVVDRARTQIAGTPPDSCGSGAIELTAEITMADGHRSSFNGHGDSPCNASPPGDAIKIDLFDLPTGHITGVRLQSSKPIGVRSVEWQSWTQGI